MVLSDRDIVARCGQEPRLLEPFVTENVQPASVDVRLGSKFRIFQRDHRAEIDLADPDDITKVVDVPLNSYLTLHPGEFVLGHTIERVNIPRDLVARVEGKSSLGRLGLFVHITAGYIDPGFQGQVTLEMACLHPLAIRLRPEMPVAQISFHQLASPAAQSYQGRYQGDEGAVSSRYGDRFDVLPRLEA